MGGNPFTYGNPISDPRRFFGRAREVEQIFGRLRNEEFESSSVVGERRIGKTSLLNYLADPDVRAAHGLDPGRYAFVYVDLQMVDDATTDQDLRVPPSNHFEKLRGSLAGFHSIRVNSQWRLVFRWDGSRGEAEGVYLDDHSYR